MNCVQLLSRILRASPLLALAFFFQGAQAQTQVNGSYYGETITTTDFLYRTCDNTPWRARYLGNYQWMHTNQRNGASITSAYINFKAGLTGSKCMSAELDYSTAAAAGGVFFKTKQIQCGSNCSPDVQLTQSLDVYAPDNVAGIQWDERGRWNNRRYELNPQTGHILQLRSIPSEFTASYFAPSLEYNTCDGSAWSMSYPHLYGSGSTVPRRYPIVVSHSPFNEADESLGSSHVSTTMEYVDWDEQCRRTTLTPGTTILYTYKGRRQKWVVPFVPQPADPSSFAAFYIQRL